MTYLFEEQLRIGKEAEGHLDEFFSPWFDIRHASLAEEKASGIDREFVCKHSGFAFTVEYKRDSRAHSSKNAFIEMVSSVEDGKPGWARSSKAGTLVHYIPEGKIVRLISLGLLRHWLPYFVTKYEWKDIPNDGYTTRGLLVPLAVIDKTCCVGELNIVNRTLAFAFM